MSNLEAQPRESPCGGALPQGPPPPDETLLPREVPLGGPRGFLVRRTLPHRAIRTIGAWCFIDHYGPHDPGIAAMVVPPHPHIGLQTVSWLLEGEIEHRDSVGSVQTVRPGALSLMTAGRGIAHSEYSTPAATSLFGVQLWVALPAAHRHQPPHFEHHTDLPAVAADGVTVQVFLGEWGGVASPAITYTRLLGAQVAITAGADVQLRLEPGFEHGILVADGAAEVDGEPVPFGGLRYLGWGRESVTLASADGAVLLLLGGQPLTEELLMWWNFVGRDHEEIEQARADWAAGRRFGAVAGDDRPVLAAPPLPVVRMMPRPSRQR